MEKTNVSGVGNRLIKIPCDIFVKQKLAVFRPFCGSMPGDQGFAKIYIVKQKPL
jgi:hypothetical protein